ncbi:MAG: hypothetical protein Q4F95_02320 [Oscillospiraceae bacterium]|nr:hypothetical protein [Oscillospiraceae bacterium]
MKYQEIKYKPHVAPKRSPPKKQGFSKMAYSVVPLHRDKENPYDIIVIAKDIKINPLFQILENKYCPIIANGLILFDLAIFHGFKYNRFMDVVIINTIPQPFSSAHVEPDLLNKQAKEELLKYYTKYPDIFNQTPILPRMKQKILSGYGIENEKYLKKTREN